MKGLKLLLVIVVLGLSADLAMAQTTGTVTISGTDPESFSITNASNGSLSSTVAFGNLTPAGTSSLATGSVTVRLRTNKAYKLTAQTTSLNFVSAGAADNGDSVSLNDIGFGISSVEAGGDGANVANASGHQIISKFDYDPSSKAVTNGLTPFVAGTDGTLSDITSATQVLSGGRISKKGNITTDNNFIGVTFKIATLPQYFTPNSSFSTTLTLTIASQ